MHRVIIDAPRKTEVTFTFDHAVMNMQVRLPRHYSMPLTFTFPVAAIRAALAECQARADLAAGLVPDLSYLMPELFDGTDLPPI